MVSQSSAVAIDTMSAPIVKCKQGAIRGTSGTDLDGGTFYKFLGIPFAKPPVGPLRFKAPEPAEIWEGIYDGTKNGNVCLQMGPGGTMMGSEDCLYLNIHVKSLKGFPKPVMVFLHGGAFTMGSGTEQMCGAEYLMTKDIVFVSINYRLGVLGFLSLEDTSLGVPGNAGLKDQALALKWVQENIASFNGNPNNVTIFGVSAGGASVQFQLLSPLSKGLFHKAIAQSGSVFDPWAWGQRNVQLVAEKLGKTIFGEKEALQVLVEANGDDLVQASLMVEDNILNVGKRRPFGPIIEKPNPTAFLTEDPAVLLSSGRFNQVPLIQGVCSNEGHIYESLKVYVPNATFNQDNNYLPWHLLPKVQGTRMWIDKVKDFYFKDGDKEALHKHLSDVGFINGARQSLRILLKKSTKPVYFYLFNYETDNIKAMKKMLNTHDSEGVGHGQDGNLLLKTSSFAGPAPLTEDDKKGIKTMVQLWTDFANSGRPHPLCETVQDAEDVRYLRIEKELRMDKGLYEDRASFWKAIFEEADGVDLLASEKPDG